MIKKKLSKVLNRKSPVTQGNKIKVAKKKEKGKRGEFKDSDEKTVSGYKGAAEVHQVGNRMLW